MTPSTANFMRWDTPGWAAVTGASSGIGEEFARQLASQGFSLLLTARRSERLASLAGSLGRQHGVRVETYGADLSRSEDIARLAERLWALEDLDVLVSNAGFSTVGPFVRADLGRQLEMLSVHNVAPTVLSRAVLPAMVRRDRGVIIFTSSMAAFIPAPGAGLYTPSKAFLSHFARTLALELKPTHVRVLALCPGYTRTEFHDDPAFDSLKAALPKFVWGTSRRVVEAALRGAARGKTVVVPGLSNTLARRLIPKRIMLRSYMKKRWDKVRKEAPRPGTGT